MATKTQSLSVCITISLTAS